MRAQAVFQAAHHLPFVFEGLCVLDAKFEGEKGNHKPVVGRSSCVVRTRFLQIVRATTTEANRA
jgi:hypothetical protein